MGHDGSHTIGIRTIAASRAASLRRVLWRSGRQWAAVGDRQANGKLGVKTIRRGKNRTR
jgi:hypothetical protein